MKSFLLLLFIITCFSGSSEAKTIWEMQKVPAAGKAESIGTYSNGCIVGAASLPAKGYGWQVSNISENRHYAHPEMVGYIGKLAKLVKDELNSTLIVADVSLPKGGPFTSGHRSHHTGLDADINYQAGEYQESLLKIAAGFDEVDRIFVNPAIKREICSKYKGSKWLNKVRPWWGHNEHFHVRLKCPQDSPDCKTDYMIDSDGCDKTLDWWFKERTKAELEDMKKKEDKRKMMEPPERCLGLVDSD